MKNLELLKNWQLNEIKRAQILSLAPSALMIGVATTIFEWDDVYIQTIIFIISFII